MKFRSLFLYISILFVMINMLSCNGRSNDNINDELDKLLINVNTTDPNIEQSKNNNKDKQYTINVYLYLPYPFKKNDLSTLKRKFEDTYPSIEVIFNIYDYEEVRSSIDKWLDSNKPPDIVLINSGNDLKRLATKGLIEELDPVSRDMFNNDFPRTIQQNAIINNNIFMMPVFFDWWVFYYKKSVFREQNLKKPNDWKEFINICDKLKSKGINPISFGSNNIDNALVWFDYLNIRLNGYDFYKKYAEGSIPYTHENIKNVFTNLGTLDNNNYFPKNHSEMGDSDMIQSFISGNSAMCLYNQDIFGRLNNSNIKNDVAFFKFPLINKEKDFDYERVKINGFAVASNSKNKTQALKFIEYISRKEVQGEIANKFDKNPANIKVHFNDVRKEKIIDDFLLSKGVFLGYKNDAVNAISKKNSESIQKYLENPKNIDNILFNMEKDRRKIIEGENVENLIKADITIYSTINDADTQKIFYDLVKKFDENNQYINTKIINISADKLLSSFDNIINGNNPPDVVILPAYDPRFVELSNSGFFRKINHIYDLNDYNMFRNVCGSDNNIYMFPFTFDWNAVYYRESHFETYKLDVPKTLEDFIRVCGVFEMRNITPVSVGTKDGEGLIEWFEYINLRVNGIDFHNDFIRGKASFNSAEIKAVFDYFEEFAYKEYFIKSHSGYNSDEAYIPLFRREGGFYLSGKDIYYRADKWREEYKVTRDLQSMRFPAVNNSKKYELSEVTGFCIPENSNNIQASELFLKFISKSENLKEFSELETTLIANKTVKPADKRYKPGHEFIFDSDMLVNSSKNFMPKTLRKKFADMLKSYIRNQDDLAEKLNDLELIRTQ